MRRTPTIDREAVRRLWLVRQGLATPRGETRLDPRSLTDHLERTGGLQLDSVYAVDRAHYLTLWSRFGVYDRADLDRWVYRDRLGYEYWGHEASILPISQLPIGARRMRRFPPRGWRERAWWPRYRTSAGSKRRVLGRIRDEGPLESTDFERRPGDLHGVFGKVMPLFKEDGRSLKLLWHAGRLAVDERRHFRRVYDLADRVYPEVEPVSPAAFEDRWLLGGLFANGVASEAHLVGYFTDADLLAADRRRVIARNLRKGRVVEVRVEGVRGLSYVRAEDLETLHAQPDALPEPRGTTLICPFDSLLWQRRRAEELLGFTYKLEIYLPPAKRQFGYYVLPILHDGRLVGRLDPKLHRDRGELEIKTIVLEPGVDRDRRFDRGLAEALDSLRVFLGAEQVTLPRGWRRLMG